MTVEEQFVPGSNIEPALKMSRFSLLIHKTIEVSRHGRWTRPAISYGVSVRPERSLIIIACQSHTALAFVITEDVVGWLEY